MSLAVLADHMASKGRGPDSMLIHMSPREVQGLQALAMKHGGSLTINPDTGLPEAGILDKLLPAVLGFALGPAGFALATPLQAAMVVGGIQAVRTGDIGKGISAGLGAYGGAGLSGATATAGASQMAGEALVPAAMEQAALEGITLPSNYAEMAARTVTPEQIAAAQQTASPMDLISKGATRVGANPMDFATKDNLKYLSAAAGPAIMAGANVQAKGPQTVTKPGMIRPYSYDPYGGGYVAGAPYEAAPTRAAEGGLMGMAQGGYTPGMFDFAQHSEPVVRMAEGGVPGYANGGPLDVNNPIYQYFAKPETQALLAAGNDAAVAKVLQDNDWKLSDVAAATGTQDKFEDYSGRFVKAINTPTTSAQEFQAMTADVGLQNQALENAMDAAGMSQAAQYAATHGLDDKSGITGPASGFYNQFGYKAGALPGDQGGLEGYYSNINYSAQGLQGLIDAGKMTGQQAREAALTEMNRIGMSEGDLKAATGKTLKELFPDTKVVTPITKVTGTGTGTGTDVVTPPPFTSVTPTGYYGNDTGNPLTRTPGDITTNPDGTVTIQPNIPGRPTGGFPGMASVRDAYTAGGGSLGYIPYVPKTIEEFESKYNKLTGGSKQAYDYLMGKTPYSPTPYTPTGEVMKPYAESVLGMPANLSKKMYIFDPATKTYKINPDYAIPTYDKDGKKTYNLTNKDVITYMATKPAPADFYNWAKTNNLTVEQIAAATGMPITEVQKMLTGGTPADTATAGGSGGSTEDTSYKVAADGGLMAMARGGSTQYDLGDYSDGGRLLRGPGDGVSDSIPASIGNKRPARLADGEFVVPARIVSELGNGSTEAGARKLYAMMDRIQAARRGTVGKGRVAKNSRADKHLPA